MEQFVIRGGNRLSGTIRASGNKNAATKMIPACLLTDEPVTLTNMPDIVDVQIALELMQSLGASVEKLMPGTVRIHAKHVNSHVVDSALAQKTRASFVFAGPMLGRMGQVHIPAPGGDVIGERRLDSHVVALRKLGADVEYERGHFNIKADLLKGADMLLPEASVTASENAIMAAVLAQGTTVIRNAAGEPHVQDLCKMLVALGAKIDGIGSNRIVIEGVERLHGGEARIGADFMEVGSYIGAAAVTGGSIRIQEADPEYLDMVALVFDQLGVKWEIDGQDIVVPERQSLSVVNDLGGRIPRIKAQPWPGFPPDLMSIALVVATQSAGAIVFHDWMYESRFFFTDKLSLMGARITQMDPHRVLVQGPTALKGAGYISSPDIRAGMALVLAALAARGETIISNIRQIDRGYERVEEKLTALGANVQRIKLNSDERTQVGAMQLVTGIADDTAEGDL